MVKLEVGDRVIFWQNGNQLKGFIKKPHPETKPGNFCICSRDGIFQYVNIHPRQIKRLKPIKLFRTYRVHLFPDGPYLVPSHTEQECSNPSGTLVECFEVKEVRKKSCQKK